ncbi:universal stress protein [Aporhodopirellula aestuarii]|uniref:Universal stress protein n=1 Tax=Aporhodopirellula aestuarii TaxID=2950107 RepID=A0ABT0TZ25_9BACT|nr:universal stress protein [Aporhodopirellula aestuarii]MCM2369858.1 universal stress protein [Aporhodopirellula aestuarii]
MKSILLATDGSSVANDAARFLAHLPHDEKIELTVVTALYVPGTQKTYVVGDWYKSCLARERERAAHAFASVEEMFSGANVQLKHIVREGQPAETIVAVAREIKPELVVVGATGHSGIARVLLGSTSDYVATHAPCSVLVIRPTGAVEGIHPLRVVIGYEGSGPSRAALEEFAEFDWGPECNVRLVSVVYPARFYDAPPPEVSKEDVVRAAEELHEVAPKAKGCMIESDHVGEGLVRFAESHEVDLMVVGETPRTRLGRVLMGSLTRFVLRHAPCSVWITRNRMIHGVNKKEMQQSGASLE